MFACGISLIVWRESLPNSQVSEWTLDKSELSKCELIRPRIVFILPACLAFLPKTYVCWMSYASLVPRISWIIMYKAYRFYWVEPSGSRLKCCCTVSPSHNKGSSVLQKLESVGWIHYFHVSSCCAFGCRVRGMAGAQDQQTPTPMPPQQPQTVPSASVCFGSYWRRCHLRLWLKWKITVFK